MQSHKNTIIVASAGSRKTTCIVEAALRLVDKPVLITTYTNENVDQIKSYLIRQFGHIPAHISVQSWFSFLLQEGVRPYQNYMTDRGRIKTINFTAQPNRYARKDDIDAYYLTRSDAIYRDHVSAFICECDIRSGGRIMRRLENVYGSIFIDELQDLAGYDLTFLEKLLTSSINVVAVGDPRQATFSTNNSLKNKQYKKGQILKWIKDGEVRKLFTVEERVDCYRSNQSICDFADALFPALPKTKSLNTMVTGHDGIFFISPREVPPYIALHDPVALRHNKATETLNLPALNIGLAKGRTFDRVLIFPTAPMKKYLKTRNINDAGDRAKLYVAVTRAKHSATFVV